MSLKENMQQKIATNNCSKGLYLLKLDWVADGVPYYFETQIFIHYVMYFIIAALVLGLAGSLHCAGMCGPLVSVMLYNRPSWLRFAQTTAFNHSGRILTYIIFGVLF